MPATRKAAGCFVVHAWTGANGALILRGLSAERYANAASRKAGYGASTTHAPLTLPRPDTPCLANLLTTAARHFPPLLMRHITGRPYIADSRINTTATKANQKTKHLHPQKHHTNTRPQKKQHT